MQRWLFDGFHHQGFAMLVVTCLSVSALSLSKEPGYKKWQKKNQLLKSNISPLIIVKHTENLGKNMVEKNQIFRSCVVYLIHKVKSLGTKKSY